ncbi:acyltransferase family protein [Mucilaginibacter gotjawali]|uniref:acyltransferase family protein n=1 Tax=Mucilaginibacter gotjawali TaxID=1550579 RepID=UPI0021CFB1C0|nr:acyltransferase [Mucilaginibacter gotjawali]
MKSLTGIRGLAAVYVIIFHWYVVLFHKKPQLINHYLSVLIGHGYLSVDLFFVLSGFLLSLTSSASFNNHLFIHDYKAFMYKRFCRIFPLYIVATLLYFFLFHFGEVESLIVNLTLLQGVFSFSNNSLISPGWSLTNEWVIYFFLPLAFYLTWKIRNKAWILILSSITIFIAISIFRNDFLNWGNSYSLQKIHGFNPVILFTRGPSSFLRTIADYLLGIFAYLSFERIKKRAVLLKYSAIPLVVFLFFKKTDILIILLMPFFMVHITERNVINRFLSSKVVYFLGLISYSLYVNHFLFIDTYDKISKSFGLNTNNYLIISACYVATGTLIFSTITYYAIEKPALKYLKKMGERFI